MREALFLSMFVLVPALAFAFAPPMARRVCFVLGMLLFGSSYLPQMRGADNSLLIVPLIGIGIATGALLVEAIALVVGIIRKLRSRGNGTAAR